ncbi:unnamed protein product [Moneuplotes crassus]|uniref:Uncharacterized protein n=1 Tax=Euplotes crassus TaxID=5936 RepID=A0AAD1Y9C5_EUPCR|nr:unnamed protein product [Moneuplotes crassus]
MNTLINSVMDEKERMMKICYINFVVTTKEMNHSENWTICRVPSCIPLKVYTNRNYYGYRTRIQTPATIAREVQKSGFCVNKQGDGPSSIFEDDQDCNISLYSFHCCVESVRIQIRSYLEEGFWYCD